MNPNQNHTCMSTAPGCSHPTMSTWKRKLRGKKETCGACSTNVRNDVPQHDKVAI